MREILIIPFARKGENFFEVCWMDLKVSSRNEITLKSGHDWIVVVLV